MIEPGMLRRAHVGLVSLVSAAAVLLGCFDDLSRPRGEDAVAPSTTTISPVGFDAVYVVDGEGPSVSVIDAERNLVAATIGLRGVAYPYQIALSPDRSLLGVAVPGYDLGGGESGHEHHSSRPGQILLIDARTGALAAAKRTDAANNNVAFSPDGDVWTSQATQPGSTLVLDRALTLKDVISVGQSPAQTVLAKDGSLAYVANSGSSSVSVIDVPTRKLKATIAVGAGPSVAQPGPSGMVYVKNEIDRSISVVDPSTFRVVKAFTLEYVPGTVAPADRGEIWISAPSRDGIEIRSENGEILRFVPTGRGAHSVAFSADGTRAYASNQLEDTVAVIDRSSFTVTARIPVGARPNGLAWRSR